LGLKVPFVGKRGNICNIISFKCTEVKGVHGNKVLTIQRRNGSVKMTGLVNNHEVAEFHILLQAALRAAFSSMEAHQDGGSTITMTDPILHLLNGSFYSGFNLDLDNVQELLTTEYNRDVRLNREVYNALMFKEDSVTVSIFPTGNVLLLGGRATKDCLAAFRFVMLELVSKHEDKIKRSGESNNNKRKTATSEEPKKKTRKMAMTEEADTLDSLLLAC
jgi:TATA-box binding protein (TBP) (component of TFIID and TFIIIB)